MVFNAPRTSPREPAACAKTVDGRVFNAPRTPHREPAACVITVDGSGLDALYPSLRSVTVDVARDEAAQGTLEFESRRDEHGAWNVQDAKAFRTWAAIVIDAEFGSKTETILRGRVREMRAVYSSDPSKSTFTVTCQDQSYALDRQHRRRAWGVPDPSGTCAGSSPPPASDVDGRRRQDGRGPGPTDDRTIVCTLLGQHGLVLHCDSGDGLSGLVLLQDSTDIRFLRKRAQANGYELIFGTDSVYFGPMRVASEPQPTIFVDAGTATNCVTFDVRDDSHLPDSASYDRADDTTAEVEKHVVTPDLELMGAESVDSSDTGLDPFSWRLTGHGSKSAAELRAIAQARANEMAMKVKAEGELDGTTYGHVLRVGEPVRVDGVGRFYGGVYYVDTVTHRFTEEGYRQSFTLLRNAHGDGPDTPGGPPGGLP